MLNYSETKKCGHANSGKVTCGLRGISTAIRIKTRKGMTLTLIKKQYLLIKVYDESDSVVYEHEETVEIPKIYLGKFPVMLQSDMCILKGLSPEVRYNMGECRNDKGGYFIIDGKEKVIICQEKFADNTLYIQDKVSDVYSYSAKIRSVSEDASKPVRTLAVRMVAEQPSSSNIKI